MLLSIVIPVYNTDKYLDRCVASILSQGLDDYEVILIDDGSTDNSGRICDNYAEQYPDIFMVVHQENGGQSKARNVGMDYINGRYVFFMDSDDYLFPGKFKEMVFLLQEKESDIIVGRRRDVIGGKIYDKVSYKKMEEGEYTGKNFMNSFQKANNGFAQFTVYNNIYNVDFLKKTKLHFLEGVIYEDELWIAAAMLRAAKVYYTGIPFYVRYVRDGSTMHSLMRQYNADSLFIISGEMDGELKNVSKREAPGFHDRLAFLHLQSFAISDWKDNKRLLERGRLYPLKHAVYRRQILKSLFYAVSPGMYYRFCSKKYKR